MTVDTPKPAATLRTNTISKEFAPNAISAYISDPDPSGMTNIRETPGGKLIGRIGDPANHQASNDDDYYDDDDDVYYREPEYVNYQNNNARGFGGYRESERNQRMTVHDGGQYSIIYDDEVDY